MSFQKDLKKFSINLGDVSEKVFRGTSIDISTKVITRTPVDTGRARGNWFPSFDEPSEQTTTNVSKTGLDSITRATQKVRTSRLGQSFYLTNNLPYIERLENGYSDQAPNGMVERTLVEFQRIVDQNANKNRK